MTSNKNHFKKLLEAEKAKLESELKSVGKNNPENQEEWEPMQTDVSEGESSDRADVADSITTFESNTAILKDLDTELIEVEEALAKIANGTYGICVICGAEIENERLEASPSAKTCKAHIS